MAKTVSEKGARPVTSSGGPISVATSSEARRVYVLSLLYFPSMREEARTLLNSSYEFYLLMQSLDNFDPQKLTEITSNYRAAKKALDDLTSLEAEKIT
ncbi:hypothetical protein [Desulfobulbus propionicus]|uniref:hypothetical protein n=1 Tax=Desulfobulbus propionicus TaxID=894 RepID=UPI001469E60B|nr:hypothetical protein [Desulfobulbus propionicus]